ncbi:MAG: sigma factor [Polyangiaceae bacterium]
MDAHVDALAPDKPEVVEHLVANHRRFLAFLDARLKDRAQAEELLQAAFVKAVEKAHTLRDDESAVAWFFRLLRNGLVDHYREVRKSSREGDQALAELPSDPEITNEVCRCIDALIPTLKPEYGTILRRVELDENPCRRWRASFRSAPTTPRCACTVRAKR